MKPNCKNKDKITEIAALLNSAKVVFIVINLIEFQNEMKSNCQQITNKAAKLKFAPLN